MCAEPACPIRLHVAARRASGDCLADSGEEFGVRSLTGKREREREKSNLIEVKVAVKLSKLSSKHFDASSITISYQIQKTNKLNYRYTTS